MMSFMVSCGSDGGGDPDPNPDNNTDTDTGTNTTPVARAGVDQTIITGSIVTLDGSASSNASTYSWSVEFKPSTSVSTLSDPTVAQPTFTADVGGIYSFILTVNNGTENSAGNIVRIYAISTRSVPDTGQTTVYDAGDDGTYINNPPSYTDNTDETITDNVTGLIWQKCTVGKSGAGCSAGTASVYNWYEASGTTNSTSNPDGATNVCEAQTTAGFNDWRLPTDFELMSIADYESSTGRAISLTYFPDTTETYYWASNDFALLDAWSVGFGGGQGIVATATKPDTFPASNVGSVRCVRGEQSLPLLTDNNDATVTDVATGLMWQKQDDGVTKNWTNAINYCENLSLATHTDWRLPNIKELRSIADMDKFSPTIDTTFFPGTSISDYWSSTSELINANTFAWTVSFISGSVDNTENKTDQYYVRCVR